MKGVHPILTEISLKWDQEQLFILTQISNVWWELHGGADSNPQKFWNTENVPGDCLLLNCLPRKPLARRIPSLKEEDLLIVENVKFPPYSLCFPA